MCLGVSLFLPLSRSLQKVRGMVLEDVVMLNVDTNTLETPFDDLQSLPNDVVSIIPLLPPSAPPAPHTHPHQLRAGPSAHRFPTSPSLFSPPGEKPKSLSFSA